MQCLAVHAFAGSATVQVMMCVRSGMLTMRAVHLRSATVQS